MKRYSMVSVFLCALLVLAGCPVQPPPTPSTSTTLPPVPAVPVKVLVVDSVNGTKVGSAQIAVYKTGTATPAATATASNGAATVNLVPGNNYDFVALPGSTTNAASIVQNYPVKNDLPNACTIVQQRLGMINRPAAAPIVTAIALKKGATSVDLSQAQATPASMVGPTQIVVTITGKSSIEPTAWSGFGAKLGIGLVPSTFNGISGSLQGPNTQDGSGNFTASYLFDLTDAKYPAGTYDAAIVGYDVANNRCEYHFPLQIADNSVAAAFTADTTVSAFTVDLRAYPISRGYFGKPGAGTFALNPYNGEAVSYRAAVSFNIAKPDPLDATKKVPVPILSFDIYRGKTGETPVKIGTQLYAAPKAAASHTWFDTDSLLEEGVEYAYYARVFADATHSLTSATVHSTVPKPFALNLTQPADKVSFPANTAQPYSFSISNPALWNATLSDFFYFVLIVHGADNAPVFLGRYRYNFSKSQFEIVVGSKYYPVATLVAVKMLPPTATPASCFDYANGVVTIKPDMLEYNAFTGNTPMSELYQAGTSYEWDILGDIGANIYSLTDDSPAWFEKSYDSGGGIAKTYCNEPNAGSNAINGRFSFNVTAAAP